MSEAGSIYLADVEVTDGTYAGRTGSVVEILDEDTVLVEMHEGGGSGPVLVAFKCRQLGRIGDEEA